MTLDSPAPPQRDDDYRPASDAPLQRLRLRPRQVALRLILFWRVRPQLLAPLLPEGMEPLVIRGSSLVMAAYTRNAGRSGRWVAKRLGAPVDSLAYRVPVEYDRAPFKTDSTGRGTYVPRRATTSWIEARFGARLMGGRYARARFHMHDAEDELALRIEAGEEIELILRATSAALQPSMALMRDRREVEALLRSTASVVPRDPLAPEADRLLPKDGLRFTPEPLHVHELLAPWIEEYSPLAGEAVFDSAYRLRHERRLPVGAPHARRAIGFEQSGVPAT